MPEGVSVEVDEHGEATIDFLNHELRGPGLAALLATGSPIQMITRDGPRFKYRVPEGNAREAGLLDVPEEDVLAVPHEDRPAPVKKTPTKAPAKHATIKPVKL